jgi:hypothetical protein
LESGATIAPTGGAWTFSAWVKPTTTVGERYFIGQEGYRIAIGIKSGLWVFFVQCVDASFPAINLGSFSSGTTYNVTAVFTGTVLRLYVNGVQQGTDVTPSAAIIANPFTFGIGGSSGQNWQGGIDEVMYWGTTALSGANVTTLYQTGSIAQ